MSNLIPSAPFYVGVDLETTSGKLMNGGIIEIGMAVSDHRGYVMDIWDQYCNPFSGEYKEQIVWGEEAARIHKIPFGDVISAAPIDEVLQDFHLWLEQFPGHIILAHHISFDIPFLRLAYERARMAIEPRSFWSPYDVPSGAYHTAGKGIKMPNAREIREYTGIKNLVPHKASNDALDALNQFWATKREIEHSI